MKLRSATQRKPELFGASLSAFKFKSGFHHLGNLGSYWSVFFIAFLFCRSTTFPINPFARPIWLGPSGNADTSLIPPCTALNPAPVSTRPTSWEARLLVPRPLQRLLGHPWLVTLDCLPDLQQVGSPQHGGHCSHPGPRGGHGSEAASGVLTQGW